MRNRLIMIFTALLIASFASAEDKKEAPDVTMDGLHLLPDTNMQYVYAEPGASLSQYTRIFLVQPQVSFIKGWRLRMNSTGTFVISENDMERIRTEVADLFLEVFTEELQNNGGYVIVDGVAEDVLAVRPAIIDLDPLTPSMPTRPNTRSLIRSAGQMTLYIELIDSVSGDIMVKALDNQVDRTRATPQIRDADRNEYAARQILEGWATLLREALDEAHTRTATSTD